MMKHIILLGDGMTDYPIEELGGKTPLEYASTPNMDYIASRGTVGLVNTIMDGFTPASDVANLAMLGYDANDCYCGRAPLEAASMGIDLSQDDVAFRCNLVTIEGWPQEIMVDFTAGQITSAEAKEMIDGLNIALGNADFQFYPGVSYRHLLLWRKGKDQIKTTPPHDIIGQRVADYMPTGEGAGLLHDLIWKSQEILRNHRINEKRKREGKRPATSIWLWGQGRKPRMKKLTEEYGITGGMISAVDLLHGIGVYAGLESLHVPGATGYIDTNYLGKGRKALEALRQMDFVFVHVEAPDAMGHEGNLEGKIKAIEDFDEKVVGTVLNGMDAFGSYRLMVASDHPTPVSLLTHSREPSPFAVLSSKGEENLARGFAYNERAARESGIFISPGFELFHLFMKGWHDFVQSQRNKERL